MLVVRGFFMLPVWKRSPIPEITASLRHAAVPIFPAFASFLHQILEALHKKCGIFYRLCTLTNFSKYRPAVFLQFFRDGTYFV